MGFGKITAAKQILNLGRSAGAQNDFIFSVLIQRAPLALLLFIRH